MRICHVVEAAGGGVGQVIIDLVRHGLISGHDVTVIYALSRATPHFIQTLSPMLGAKLIPISMQREVGLHDIPDAWNLHRCLRQAGPFDVIHGHSSKAGALVRITGVLFPRALKVYSPHAFVTLNSQASCLYGIFEKILSWFSGIIVTLSLVEKEHALHKLHINPRKVAVIPNGIQVDYPANRITARQLMGYEEDEFLVGFVGRFVPQKNPLRSIDAFGLASKTEPSMQLALVGDGTLRGEMDEFIAEKQLTDKVHYFSGYVGRDLIPGLDCLICSSDYEGFAIIFLEALAAGVPIVTTPVGGAHETVIEGETGFMTSDFSVESLAGALAKLKALTPEMRAKMSERTRQHAKKFKISVVGEQMWDLYQRYAKGKKSPA